MTAPLRFRVPGSTTNLGHGFDCLGAALGCVNTVSVKATGEAVVTAPGARDAGLVAMAARVREACTAAWSTPVPSFQVEIEGEVPIARGMGSSSTILLGVAAACQALAKRPWSAVELLPICAALEGHPDNVAAACLGGFTVVGAVGDQLRWTRFAAPEDLRAVVAIPPFEVKTSEARRILPGEIPKADHVQALQRTALITAALAAKDPERLRGLFDGAWHERHRATLNPGLPEARAAAAKAGALGTILSGSGSTVLSFATAATADAVAAAVTASYAERGVTAEVRILPFDNQGITRVKRTATERVER
jgi:homoserine kinase